MKKHWATFLASFNAASSLGGKVNAMESLLDKKASLNMQLRRLQNDITDLENEIVIEVKTEWSTGEMLAARDKSIGI